MSDWVGSGSSAGQVRLPAVFHGTARLLDGSEPPSPPRMPRFDDLSGEFQADLTVSFALLTGVGYEPVHPDHPAYADYVAASAAHAVALPSEPLHGPDPLIVTKANTKSVVHRRAYLDYIGVKMFDDSGKLSGELRVVGLFTSSAYNQSVLQIPYLRSKARAIIESVDASIAFEPPSYSFLRSSTSFRCVPFTRSEARSWGDLPANTFCTSSFVYALF